jgi:hypothetical protein
VTVYEKGFGEDLLSPSNVAVDPQRFHLIDGVETKTENVLGKAFKQSA